MIVLDQERLLNEISQSLSNDKVCEKVVLTHMALNLRLFLFFSFTPARSKA